MLQFGAPGSGSISGDLCHCLLCFWHAPQPAAASMSLQESLYGEVAEAAEDEELPKVRCALC